MTKENWIGIDYSLGKSNINHNTGIHFGEISIHEVLQNWADSSEPVYFYTCPNCGHEYGYEYPDLEFCPACKEEITDNTFDDLEPACFEYDAEGYKASQSGDDTDIFILESPFYSYSQFCSPCAPGAGYLMNPVIDGVKTYCFGHDWFENGKAPYPVYDIKTGKKITI